MDPPAPSDAPAILAIASDPKTVEHNPSDRLRSLSEAESLVARWQAHWQELGFGYWCARRVEEAEVIGYCGLKVVTFRGDEVLNLIYRFVPTVWGAGLATEATRAVLAWVDEHQPHRPVIARVRPANLASRQVARKAGLHLDPTLTDEGEDGPDLIFTR